MSRDDPFGGGGGKTVIRPNPGGGGGQAPRRPQPTPGGPAPGGPPPGGMQPFPSGPAPGGMQPMPGGGSSQQWGSPAPQQESPGYNPRVNAPGYQQGPGFAGQQGYGMPAGGGGAPGEDWLKGPSQQMFPQNQAPAPPPDAPKIPLQVALNARDGGQISAANPITAAAAPLLILLGRLRLQIVELQAAPLMDHVANEIMNFERRCLEGGVDANDVRVAKYALCGTADDIIQNLPGPDKSIWLQYSMLARFFQMRTSGVGFYEELNKILRNPGAHYDLLELMHACLSLGFEGQYRMMPNGANELARVRRDVYQTIRHLKSRADDDISPRWRGLELKMAALTNRVPLWAIISAAAALLIAVFFVLRILLGQNVDDLADRLVALNPGTPITLERKSNFVPAVVPDSHDPTQLERIRAALGGDKCLTADGVGDSIVIRVCNLLFDTGSAQVKKDFVPLAAKIATALEGEQGSITVTGYTDNVKPSGTGRYKSNYDLSLARAKAVAAIMSDNVKDATRIQSDGKGELEPFADNSTPEGRAANRRVEVAIPRQQ